MFSRLLYNLGIQIYLVGIKIKALTDERARNWLQGRRGLMARMQSELPAKREKRIWIHCASLGEFEQGRPVLEEIRQLYPSALIILTFFSPSGYEVRKNYEQADHIYYLPIDTAGNARKFLDIVQPDMALFVKYEYWYHFLQVLSKRHIPTVLFAAILRKRQIFFKWYGGIFRKILRSYSYIFLQDEPSAQLLGKLGVDSTQYAVAPDTRFDRVWQIASDPAELPEIAAFAGSNTVLVAGSTWRADHQMLKAAELGNGKMVIAPHDISEENIRDIEHTFPGRTVRYSVLGNRAGNEDVLIIDAIGMLASLYRYADVAYVGGGFGDGIHNTLEPAAHGVPVLFGPRFEKFKEAKELLEIEAAWSSQDRRSLATQISRLLMDGEARAQMGKAAKNYVAQNRGGTKVIVKKAVTYL